MNQIKVLIEGYAIETKNGWKASSTTTLVKTTGQTILVDPGINRTLLLEKLKKENLTPDDITVVFMTHYHPDHNLLVGIFEKALVIDDEMIYDGDEQFSHSRIIPNTDIKIASTPGHDQFHGSLIVPIGNDKYVIAGDVFWWASNEAQDTNIKKLLSKKDSLVKEPDKLLASRKKLLEVATYIIPGHGKMFKVVRD